MSTPLSAAQADRLSRAIVRLLRLERKRLDHIVGGRGLTVPQFCTLQVMRRCGDACRMGDLAHRLLTSSATTTGIVARLEENGLVERAMDPADRRAVQVRLTERAISLLDDLAARQREHLAQTLARLEPGEREEVLRLMDRYLDALERDIGQETGES
ncbi:MAG: MarR family transcriptional regulator [Chloroflexi bacterium]|nr:MarR family transcriptional regulator [Chloroflexota bacterium]